MYKKIISLVFVTMFLFSCGKQESQISSEITEDVSEISIENTIVDTELLSDTDETQSEAKQLEQRQKDLDTFFDTLLSLSGEDKSQLACEDFYPMESEYVRSLSKTEQDLVKTYLDKCIELRNSAK